MLLTSRKAAGLDAPVASLAPGLLPTKLTRGTIDAQERRDLAARIPLRRSGDDEDLKGAAVLLASAAGKHKTGQVLAVDGGFSAVLG